MLNFHATGALGLCGS